MAVPSPQCPGQAANGLLHLVAHSLCLIAVKLPYISGIKLMSTSYSALLVIFDMILELAVVPCFLPMMGTYPASTWNPLVA